ncbi:MAG: hypothetical protein WA159_21040 [Variovorax sp.]
MRFRLAPKYWAAAYGLAVAALAAAGVAILAGERVARPVFLPAKWSSGPVSRVEAELGRMTAAIQSLDTASGMPVARNRVVDAPGNRWVTSSGRATQAQPTTEPADLSGVSLIVMVSSKGRRVVMDGRAFRPGDRLPTGDVLRTVGGTYVVLESAAGQRRRIDLSDRYAKGAVTQSGGGGK